MEEERCVLLLVDDGVGLLSIPLEVPLFEIGSAGSDKRDTITILKTGEANMIKNIN